MKIFDEKVCSPTLSFSELKQLLENTDIDPDSNFKGRNALHFCAHFPNEDAKQRIPFLLKLGTNPNSQNNADKYQNTPLHVFIANERDDIAIYFLQESEKLFIQIDLKIPDLEGKRL